MAQGQYVPRLSVEISSKLQAQLQRLIPHGILRPLINSILEDLVDILEKSHHQDRGIILSAIIAKKVSMITLLQAMHKESE